MAFGGESTEPEKAPNDGSLGRHFTTDINTFAAYLPEAKMGKSLFY